VLLDVVDKELERRGHCFVRYADDCNVYVRSRWAAERVMEGMVALYTKLKLEINPAKSAVALAWERSFLGYGFWVAAGDGAPAGEVLWDDAGPVDEPPAPLRPISRAGGRGAGLGSHQTGTCWLTGATGAA
jgi:hypothetical protein